MARQLAARGHERLYADDITCNLDFASLYSLKEQEDTLVNQKPYVLIYTLVVFSCLPREAMSVSERGFPAKLCGEVHGGTTCIV